MVLNAGANPRSILLLIFRCPNARGEEVQLPQIAHGCVLKEAKKVGLSRRSGTNSEGETKKVSKRELKITKRMKADSSRSNLQDAPVRACVFVCACVSAVAETRLQQHVVVPPLTAFLYFILRHFLDSSLFSSRKRHTCMCFCVYL